MSDLCVSASAESFQPLSLPSRKADEVATSEKTMENQSDTSVLTDQAEAADVVGRLLRRHPHAHADGSQQ